MGSCNAVCLLDRGVCTVILVAMHGFALVVCVILWEGGI